MASYNPPAAPPATPPGPCPLYHTHGGTVVEAVRGKDSQGVTATGQQIVDKQRVRMSVPDAQTTSGASTTRRVSLPITNSERGLGLPSSQVDLPGAQKEGEQKVTRLKSVGQANIDHVQLQAGNVQGGVLRAEVIEEHEREVVQRSIETTASGEVRLRQYVLTERSFHRRVFEIMYIAASNEPENPEDQELTKKEKYIDCCFQSISCKFSALKKLCGRNAEPEDEHAPTTASSAVEKIKEMSPILRRGRSRGWVIHTEMIFPLMTATCRNIWVLGELIAVLFSFILSLITFSLGKNRVFSILHFVLTIIGGILAIIDGVILVRGFCPFTVCKHNRAQVSPETAPQATDNNNSDTSENNKCCKECLDYKRNVFDLIRILLSELFFYPILICDIFEMVTSETYFFDNAVDGISFILFALSLASHLFFVYIVRIAVLIAVNWHSQKKRVPNQNIRDKCDFDPSISKSARHFQCYLVFHVCGQMVTQILMFIIIAGAIREENEHLFNTDRQDTGDTTTTVTTSTEVEPSMAMDMDESIHVSNHLWYMLVAGYILPICGILSFFIVTYFWVQEFPIGVCVDVMSGILKKPDIDDLKNIGQPDEEVLERRSKVNTYIHLTQLKKQFNGFRGTPSYSKFFYGFRSPPTVIFSLLYATLLAVFISYAFKILGGNISWIIFCLVAGFIGLIANLYVFTVAYYWILVLSAILFFIALGLIALPCICLGGIAKFFNCDSQ